MSGGKEKHILCPGAVGLVIPKFKTAASGLGGETVQRAGDNAWARK